MALTATATQGLEFVRSACAEEILHVPGDPGDTFTRGDMVVSTIGEGILDIAAADEIPVGRVADTTVCPAATVGMPKPGVYDPVAKGASDLSIIPIQARIAEGTPIYKCTFANHDDDTVAAYTAATPSLTLTSALGGNDYCNGALVYVYEGTGAGQVNVVADYVDATKVVTLHRKFATDLSTDSKVILVSGEAVASRGIGFFNRIALKDTNELDASDGSDDGEFVVFLDFRDAAEYLKNLTLPVVPAASMFMV